MKKINFKNVGIILSTFCVAIVAMALIFNACKKEELNPLGEGAPKGKVIINQVVWNGESDKAVAVTIGETLNTTRKNASGIKITSNAHSADFPGIYFIWDSKQKDNGYLKVDASVFQYYQGFVLTAKESNTYWDFAIDVQVGQQPTEDNAYVFYIPKVYNNKNINMVFVEKGEEITAR